MTRGEIQIGGEDSKRPSSPESISAILPHPDKFLELYCGIKPEDLKCGDIAYFKRDYEATKFEIEKLLAEREVRKGVINSAICDFLIRNFSFKTIKREEDSECFMYRDGIYAKVAFTFVDSIVYDILQTAYTKFSTTQVMDKIKVQTYINENDFYCHDPELIPVQNGILNVVTREVMPFSPNLYFFNKLPVEYEPIILNDDHLKFFESVIPNDEERILLQEVFGYCLLRDYRFAKFFVFVGEGRNGKSVTLNLLSHLLGHDNIVGHSIYSLSDNRFMVSELYRKMANINSDLPEGEIKDTGIIKELTGRDPISADRKFMGSLTFRNHAKLIFSTNNMPRFKDNTKGWKDRWLMIEFNERFLNKKEIDTLPIEDRDNIKTANSRILESLTTQEGLSSLLNFALDGLQALIEDDGFISTKSNEEQWLRIERRSNPYAVFCRERLEEAPFGKIQKITLKKEYIKYCTEFKLPRICEDKKLKEALFALDYPVDEGQADHSGGFGGERYWSGVALKSSQNERIEVKESTTGNTGISIPSETSGNFL